MNDVDFSVLSQLMAPCKCHVTASLFNTISSIILLNTLVTF